MSSAINKTIYDGEYVVFPLKENNAEYILESTMYHMGTNEVVVNTINYFDTGDKIEGVFSGKSVIYKLDLRNIHNLMQSEEFPTDTDTILIVSVEPGYYAKLSLDVVDENPVEPIDDKTMAEIRHETAINLITNGTEILTWYQSFKNGDFHEVCHHTALEKMIAIEDDSTYILSLEDHHHYVIYAEIYNDNNELRKYYREIFTGENMIESDPKLKHITEYNAQITPEGIDIDVVINLNINNECLNIIRPCETTAMIRLVDLGTYDQNDTDLLRWHAGYELGDQLNKDPDRKHIQSISFKHNHDIFSGTLACNVSGYHDLVIIQCKHNILTDNTITGILNPDETINDSRCFVGCALHDIGTDVASMNSGQYLFMSIDTSVFYDDSVYSIDIYGVPDKVEETPEDEPSETTKDLDYLLQLFAKKKYIESKVNDINIKFNDNAKCVYIAPNEVKRLKRVDEILDTLKDPNSEMSTSDTELYALATWLLGDPRANEEEK